MSTADIKVTRQHPDNDDAFSAFEPDSSFQQLMMQASSAAHMTYVSALLQVPLSPRRADLLWTLLYGLGILVDLLVDDADPTFHQVTTTEFGRAFMAGMSSSTEMTPAQREAWLNNCLTTTRQTLAASFRVPDDATTH